MPNWCYNTITFSGRYKNFAKQLEKHNYENFGFEFVKGGRCIFSLNKIEDGMYSFESKWISPLEELCERAKKGRFSFEIDYEELGNQIYGRAYYNGANNEFTDYCLQDDVFDRIEWDDDICKIDGEIAENECEFLEEQLELLIKNR